MGTTGFVKTYTCIPPDGKDVDEESAIHAGNKSSESAPVSANETGTLHTQYRRRACLHEIAYRGFYIILGVLFRFLLHNSHLTSTPATANTTTTTNTASRSTTTPAEGKANSRQQDNAYEKARQELCKTAVSDLMRNTGRSRLVIAYALNRACGNVAVALAYLNGGMLVYW